MLSSAIDWEQHAAGDVVQGVLSKPLQTAHGVVIAPAGATVEGRIVRLERRYVPARYFVVGLRIEQVVTKERRLFVTLVPFPAVDFRNDVSGKPEHRQLRPRNAEIGPFPTERRPGVGILLFRQSNRVVSKAGLKTEWVTCDWNGDAPCAVEN